MNLKVLRALLVVGTFALLAVLTITRSYVVYVGFAPPPPKQPASLPAFGVLFSNSFRYYLLWAIVTPGIVWLGRRVPVSRRGWARALLFHLAVVAAASVPFFMLRILLGSLFSGGLPSFARLASWTPQILVYEGLSIAPFYALVLGLGAAIQFHRDLQAKQLQAVDLQRSLAAAELDAMRMKLQPDFFFNTLNAIGSLAQAGETDAIERVVDHLGRLLRLSMETSGRQFVTLDEELALLDEYLSIEEIRFRDRLRVIRRIDPEARKALVPNLILQPLAENALVHGLSCRLGSSLVEIVARIENGALRLVIRDNGPGLPAGWKLTANAGRGLRNVEDRLRALYPHNHRFTLTNGETGGAVALVSLPLVEAGAGADKA